jgi:O-antigen/teichoic acid export membrane protein
MSLTAEKIPAGPAAAPSPHAQFFRQSGWLMIANVGSGAVMYGVHLLSKKIPAAEYGIFGVLLTVVMCVPNLPLQMVFAQQTARALATNRERELAGMIRLAWLGTLGLFLALALGVFIWQEDILTRWQIANPAALWMTLPVVLLSLWLPMFWGVMQGRQDFFWLGWSNILNGVGRTALAAFIVFFLGGYAAGMMTGVCLGLAVAVGISIWQTRVLWRLPSLPFDRRSLLGQIIPLMLGFGAVQFLFTADTMFVKAYFSGEDSAFYFSAGTLSRALMWLVIPLATVMFPKIVHSVAKSEKSNLLGLVLLGTVILAAGGALGLTILGPWFVKHVYNEAYVKVASAVLPWYAWDMVPLSLAYALVNNLLARSHFRIVPVLVLLAAIYGVTLAVVGRHAGQLANPEAGLRLMLQILGAFNLLLLGACAWFTFRSPKPEIVESVNG